MKRIINNLLKTFAILLLVGTSYTVMAQPPPPPGGGGGESTRGQANKLGGNAPIGGGVLILLALGLAYGGKKLYDNRKEEAKELA